MSGRTLSEVAAQLDTMGRPSCADDVRALERASARAVEGLVATLRIEREARGSGDEPPATVPGVVVEVLAEIVRLDGPAPSEDDMYEELLSCVDALPGDTPMRRPLLIELVATAIRWVKAIDARGQR